jgi:hypothetical protein
VDSAAVEDGFELYLHGLFVANDETVRALESAIARAKLGHAEEMAVLKRLDDQALPRANR